MNRLLTLSSCAALLSLTAVAWAQNPPPATDPYGAQPAPPPQGYAPSPYGPAPAPYGGPAPAPYAQGPYYGTPPGPPPAHTPPTRRGFLIGVGLGGGSIVPDCDDCEGEGGIALEFHVGGLIGPRLGLMFDVSAVGADLGNEITVVHAGAHFAAQFWPIRQFWLKGGIGGGQLSYHSDNGGETTSDTYPSVLFGAGFEILSGATQALDVQLRFVDTVNEGSHLTNVSLLVAYNWY